MGRFERPQILKPPALPGDIYCRRKVRWKLRRAASDESWRRREADRPTKQKTGRPALKDHPTLLVKSLPKDAGGSSGPGVEGLHRQRSITWVERCRVDPAPPAAYGVPQGFRRVPAIA